jgi:hypothetical protein
MSGCGTPVTRVLLNFLLDRLNVMLSSSLKTKPLSDAALRQAVNRVLNKGFIREAFHSEVERADRNISDDDIRYGLERKDWTLAKEPNWDDNPKHHNWEYLIRTVDVDQMELHLKLAIYPGENRIRIITKY